MTASKTMKRIAEEEYSHIAYKITPQGGIALPLDNRENAQMVEQCYRTRSTTVNPIIDWDDAEVWEFIHEYNIPYCNLYDQGYRRLGCVGCPMGNNKKELEKYPKYYKLYLLAFDEMLKNNRDKGVKCSWETAEDVMNWWMGQY